LTTPRMAILWHAVLVVQFILEAWASETDYPGGLTVVGVVLLARALIYALQPYAAFNRQKRARLVLVALCLLLLLVVVTTRGTIS